MSIVYAYVSTCDAAGYGFSKKGKTGAGYVFTPVFPAMVVIAVKKESHLNFIGNDFFILFTEQSFHPVDETVPPAGDVVADLSPPGYLFNRGFVSDNCLFIR